MWTNLIIVGNTHVTAFCAITVYISFLVACNVD
jgi:hypothetical protein